MPNKPCCIDIYHGNEVSDSPTPLAGLDQAKASGIFQLIHKVSEGTASRDSRYDVRRAKWMTGGAITVTDIDGTVLKLTPQFGGYHYFHGVDPKTEAANFIMTARFEKTDFPFIDWEAVGASGFQPSIEAADAFCSDVEAALGKPCGIYGGNVPRERFAAEKASSAILERFSKRPLWFCAYGAYSAKTFESLIPEPWKDAGVLLWQDDGDQSGPGPHFIPGIKGYCDNSTVVGATTFAQLHARWLGAPPAPSPAPALIPAAPPANAPVAAPEVLNPLPSPFEQLEGEVQHLEEEIKAELGLEKVAAPVVPVLRKKGKKPARPGAVKLSFANIFKASALPTPPAVFGHQALVTDWGDLGNTQWGDCVWAGAGHEHELWTRAGGDAPASFTDAATLSDYAAVTGFAFTDATDNGTDVADAAAYRRKTGIVDAAGQRHLITAYMTLQVGNWDEMMQAAYLFGAVGIGISFPDSADTQFENGQPWDVVAGAQIDGGHYIPVVGRAPSGNALIVSWGKVIEMTRAFYEKYNDETYAYYAPEYVDMTKLSPENFNAAALETFLQELPA